MLSIALLFVVGAVLLTRVRVQPHAAGSTP